MAWQHFTKDEFKCKCGKCKKNLMQDDFITKLDALRTKVGFPLPVSSGYRCPKYNAAVSSTGLNGPHTTGRAVDFAVSRHRGWEVLRAAMEMGFTGIGVAQKGEGRFLHLVDLTEPEHAPRPTIWSY